MKFDAVYYNGTIISMDREETKYDWIAVKDGKVAGLGYGAFNGEANKRFDLEGNTVLPGLCDCHVHVMTAGTMLNSVMLQDCTCIEDVLSLLEERCLAEPGDGWVYGFNFLDQYIKENRYPTKFELDRISHGHKVIVFAASMHGNAYNSKVDEIAAVPAGFPGVEVDEKGEPIGVYTSDEATFYAQNNIWGSFSDDEIWKFVQDCADYAVTQGVTAIHGLFGQFVEGDRDVDIVLARKDQLPIDLTVFHQTWESGEAASRGLSRVGGCLTLDGAAFEHTMACFTPYADKPELRGMLYHTDEEVYDFVSKAHARNMQCTMHAVGERAIDQLLYTYLRVFSEQGRKDIRHRLEHFCLPTDEQIEMAKELDLILSMQPSFSFFWDGAGGEFANVVGRERADRMDPFNKLIEKGVTLLSGSDAPVAPIQPLTYLAHCVNGYNKVRNISVTEAIKMCTVNAAYANNEEKEKGSLEIGKTADMAVISKNPYQIAGTDEIFDMEVLATIKDGKIIYRKPDA